LFSLLDFAHLHVETCQGFCTSTHARTTRGLRFGLCVPVFVPFSPTPFVQHSGRGSSVWTGLRSLRNGFADIRIFRQLLGQYALVIYILLPTHITSWVAHNDVYTGGGLRVGDVWCNPSFSSFSL
jgi:hypothetical protein